MHLSNGTLLQGGRYKIIDILGQGGFGITYLSIQSGLERKVAVKEFFMKELCNRDERTSHITLGTEGSRETVNRFREKFLKEARNIARLNHPNIVRIVDVFEENGTAYYVMEYAENGSLSDRIKREGYLSEPVATRYILQVADALDYIHQQKMNHLDVKPANIMLNEKDEAVLIDFGLSKQYDATTGNQTSTTPVGISEGYAPMEQYMQDGVRAFSPETDIYALGATYYKLLTGVTPPNASLVNNEGLPLGELKAKGVSEKAIAVICKAMEGRKKDRMKSVRLFKESLKSVGSSASTFSQQKPVEDEATAFSPVMQHKEDAGVLHEENSTAQFNQPATNVPQTAKNSRFGKQAIISIVTLISIAVCQLMHFTCYTISEIPSFMGRASIIVLFVGIILSSGSKSKIKPLLFISAFICSLQYQPFDPLTVLINSNEQYYYIFVVLTVCGWLAFAYAFLITSLKNHSKQYRRTSILGIVYSISSALYILNCHYFAPHLMTIPYFFVIPFDFGMMQMEFTLNEMKCIIFLLTSFASLLTIAISIIKNSISKERRVF